MTQKHHPFFHPDPQTLIDLFDRIDIQSLTVEDKNNFDENITLSFFHDIQKISQKYPLMKKLSSYFSTLGNKKISNLLTAINQFDFWAYESTDIALNVLLDQRGAVVVIPEEFLELPSAKRYLIASEVIEEMNQKPDHVRRKF